MPEKRSEKKAQGTTETKKAGPGKVMFSPGTAVGGETLEANKALVRRFEEAFVAGRVDEFDQVVARDYIEHMEMPGQKPGLQGLKDMVKQMQASFTEVTYEDQELIAESDKVVERWKVRMKHTGKDELFGEPTGKDLVFTGIDIFRIGDGKIVEHWSEVNMIGPLQQAGIERIPSIGKK